MKHGQDGRATLLDTKIRTVPGIPVIGFSREADCLESAIRSAVADVQKAGCVVERVQIERDSPLLSSEAA